MQRHPLDEPLLGTSLLDVGRPLAPLAEERNDSAIRAVVVADDPLVRAAFGKNLSRHVVGQATTREASIEVDRTRANVVVWDLGPEDAPIKPSSLSVPVVVLTAKPGIAARLLGAGAKAVLRRDAAPDVIARTLATVRDGLQVVDPTLISGAAFGESKIPAAPTPTEPLTNREIEVLELVATGMSNKQIASKLGISAHTVKFHVNAILAKLDVHTRTQAVVRGVQLGVVVV